MVADRGPATEAVTIVFTVLATIFVAARFYTRGFIVRSIKQDDWWMLGAWFVAVGFSASICAGVRYGLGMHGEDIPEEQKSSLRKAEYAFSVLYNPGLMLTKTSIIVFYLSVMSHDVDPIFKWLNWLTLAVVNLAGLALTLLNIFQCQPVSIGYTYPSPPDAHCFDIIALYQSSAPVNIITDIAILLLPMPILTKMRLPKKQKVILLITFSFGVFVTVVDVIRIAYLQDAALDRLVLENTGEGKTRIVESNDFPWYAALSFMWSAVEVNIGIVCACVPCLKPLFAKFLPSFIRSSGDMSTRGDSFDMAMDEKDDGFASPSPTDANLVTNPAAFRAPSCAEYLGEDDGDEMGFLNMLKRGPPSDPSLKQSSHRFASMSRSQTNKSTASDFDFVRMDKTRNMLKLNNRQSIWPIAVVTGMFFLWGFAYGLLDTLNGQFQTVVGLSEGEAHSLHSAYYAGYFVGPLTIGRFILKRYGFKAAMITGLCIYGCGTLVFWPSAVLASFPAFLASNFIVGFGLSCLEIAANPYTALCGPLEYAEVRLNLSQAFQAIGSVVSPLLAQRVLFKNVLNAPSLVDVQWAYLGIAIFVFLLAIVFFYIPLPEATDEQLEELAEKREAVYRTRVGPWKVIWVTLVLAVFCQWCYVGAQEGVKNAGSVISAKILAYQKPNSFLKAEDYFTIGNTVFAIGRFLAAFLNYVLKPRWILLVLLIGCAIFTGLQTCVVGDTAAAVLIMTFFWEAGVFSIIFAIAMRGMGRHTKTASAYMTAAISSGAVVPVVEWGIRKSYAPGAGFTGTNQQRQEATFRAFDRSFLVMPVLFAVAIIFPLYLNLVPAARNQVDPIHEKGRRRRANNLARKESVISDPGASTRQFGLVGILARKRKKDRMEQAMVQHVEHVEARSPMSEISPTADEKGFMAFPSPVHSVDSQRLTASPKPWKRHRNKDSGSSSGASSSVSSELGKKPTTPEKDFTPSGPAPQPTVPRPWTEKDDAIDDYHNALKGM